MSDYAVNRILLIGASIFPEDPSIKPIPNVKRNIEELAEVFANPNLGNFPKENISVLLDESVIRILTALKEFISSVKRDEGFIIYYSGHGIISSENLNLYLTTRETRSGFLDETGIPIDKFASLFKSAKSKRKVMILDCCHSGKILGNLGTLESQIQGQLQKFEGTYVMTSADEMTPATFDENRPDVPTHFTGKLIDVMRNGLCNEQSMCSVGEVYSEVKGEIIKNGGIPIPQNTSDDEGYKIPIVKNIRYNQEESVWNSAQRKQTVADYYDYINRFPEGKFIKEAEKAISQLEDEERWKEAAMKATLAAYLGYQRAFPEGIHSNEAKIKIDDILSRGESPKKISERKPRKNLLKSVLLRIKCKFKLLESAASSLKIFRNANRRVRQSLPIDPSVPSAVPLKKKRSKLVYGSLVMILFIEMLYVSRTLIVSLLFTANDHPAEADSQFPITNDSTQQIDSSISMSQQPADSIVMAQVPIAKTKATDDSHMKKNTGGTKTADSSQVKESVAVSESSNGTQVQEDQALKSVETWSQVEEAGFLVECTSKAIPLKGGVKKAKDYCNCILENIKKSGLKYDQVKRYKFSRLKNYGGSCVE